MRYFYRFSNTVMSVVQAKYLRMNWTQNEPKFDNKCFQGHQEIKGH